MKGASLENIQVGDLLDFRPPGTPPGTRVPVRVVSLPTAVALRQHYVLEHEQTGERMRGTWFSLLPRVRRA